MEELIYKLPMEIWHLILLSMDIKSIVSFSKASFSTSKLTKSDSLWRNLCTLKLGNIKFIQIANNSLELYKELLTLGTIQFDELQLATKCTESTFDQQNQKAGQVVLNSPQTFYSSKGSAKHVDEYLEFVFPGFTLINCILIKPFLAQFQKGSPTYAPKMISFSYHNGGTIITTKEFNIVNIPTFQTFDIFPAIITKTLRINLIGKIQTQPVDNIYYTCLERVKVFGASSYSTEPDSEIRKTLLSYSEGIKVEGITLGQLMQIQELSRMKFKMVRYNEILNDVYEKEELTNLFQSLLPPLRTRKFYEYCLSKLGINNFSYHFIDHINAFVDKGEDLNRDEGIILASLMKNDGDLIMARKESFLASSTDLYQVLKSILVEFELFFVSNNDTRNEICKPKLSMLHVLQQNLLELTLELGLLFENLGINDFAFHIYQNGTCLDRIIEKLLELKNYSHAVDICVSIYSNLELLDLIRRLFLHHHPVCTDFCRVLLTKYDRLHNIGDMDNHQIMNVKNTIRLLYQIPTNGDIIVFLNENS